MNDDGMMRKLYHNSIYYNQIKACNVLAKHYAHKYSSVCKQLSISVEYGSNTSWS